MEEFSTAEMALALRGDIYPDGEFRENLSMTLCMGVPLRLDYIHPAGKDVQMKDYCLFCNSIGLVISME